MATAATRRQILKGGLAAAGLGLLGIPDWALPPLTAEETLVPFTDIPPAFNPALTTGSNPSRVLDIQKISGPLTPNDQFFVTQHMGHPQIDAASYRLRISGLVERPRAF